MKHLFTILIASVLLLNVTSAQNVGQIAPDFTLADLNNVDYKLSGNKGKVVLVFLVGYSCSFCIASAPDVKSQLLDVFGSNNKFQALVIDTWDGNTSAVNGFKNRTGLNATYLQQGSKVATSWTTTYDRLVVIDSEGEMVFKGTRPAKSDVSLAYNAIEKALKNITTSTFDLKENEPVSLGQNFPNPVIKNTMIEFTLANATEVTLKIMDITGKVIATPVHELVQAGKHSVEFNTNKIPGGIYFYRLESDNFSITKKMIVNK